MFWVAHLIPVAEGAVLGGVSELYKELSLWKSPSTGRGCDFE